MSGLSRRPARRWPPIPSWWWKETGCQTGPTGCGLPSPEPRLRTRCYKLQQFLVVKAGRPGNKSDDRRSSASDGEGDRLSDRINKMP